MMVNEQKNDERDEKLHELFKRLGISYGTKGEQYLAELVAVYRPGRRMQDCLVQVGQIFGASPYAVERAARAAILRAAGRLGYSFEYWTALFGYCINPETGAPTLTEFVRYVRRAVCGPNI